MNKRIQVFEHGVLKINDVYGKDKIKFKKNHYVALSTLNILHSNKYFETRHDGIKFKQYVGVLQINGLTIEILPKIDKDEEENDRNRVKWQSALIEMLRVTKKIKVQKIEQADVKKQERHLLDIYFEYFLDEVKLLIHQGLIKQYYKETNNVKALKGKLEFSGQITKNLVHKERFYTTHQVYSKDHLMHQIISKALNIVDECSKGTYLNSTCKKVQLNFPEVKTIAVTEATFSKLPLNRKTAPYETALAISKFIILNFSPDVKSGSENMLALLFDMNSLWEQYILTRMKNTELDVQIYGQQSADFWNDIKIKPDIVIDRGSKTFIVDTKWKNISDENPSTNDLRQMYVYNDYWKADKAMLLYPSNSTIQPEFKKFNEINLKSEQHKCALGRISIFENRENNLNDKIGEEIITWFLD